jgi:hypothetical protein
MLSPLSQSPSLPHRKSVHSKFATKIPVLAQTSYNILNVVSNTIMGTEVRFLCTQRFLQDFIMSETLVSAPSSPTPKLQDPLAQRCHGKNSSTYIFRRKSACCCSSECTLHAFFFFATQDIHRIFRIHPPCLLHILGRRRRIEGRNGTLNQPERDVQCLVILSDYLALCVWTAVHLNLTSLNSIRLTYLILQL